MQIVTEPNLPYVQVKYFQFLSCRNNISADQSCNVGTWFKYLLHWSCKEKDTFVSFKKISSKLFANCCPSTIMFYPYRLVPNIVYIWIQYYRRSRPISRTSRPPTGSVTPSSRTRPITVVRAGTRGRTRAGCTPTHTTSARWCSPPTQSPRPCPEASGGQRPAVYIYHCK